MKIVIAYFVHVVYKYFKRYENMTIKWIIQDWMGERRFPLDSFRSFDDAEEFLCEKLAEDYDTDRQEYYIIQGVVRS